MGRMERREGRRSLLTAALVAAALAGCDVRTTDNWLPEIVPPGQEQVVAATQERIEPAWADPSILRIVDAAGDLRALAVRAGHGRFWTAERQSLPTLPALAGDPDEAPRALTLVSEDPVSALLAPARGDDDGQLVPVRRSKLLPGGRLQRWSVGADGIEREVLDILAVTDQRIRTSCPRSGVGVVFDRSGAWVPAVWVPDPAGGCPLLARITPPASLETTPAP